MRDRFRDFRERRLSNVRPFHEFVDYNRVSRPRDTNEAVQRITYNTRHFSGNYAVLMAVLAVYGLCVYVLTQDHGAAFDCRRRRAGRRVRRDQQVWYVAPASHSPGADAGRESRRDAKGTVCGAARRGYVPAPHAGIVLLWFANPFSFVFWLVGSSAILVLGHATCIEPPVSSEYAGVEVRMPRLTQTV